MEKQKVTINYNCKYDAFKFLQCGNYFVAKDKYGSCLFLYIDDNCIINIEEGGKVDKDYFSQFEEIEIIKKLKITIEE